MQKDDTHSKLARQLEQARDIADLYDRKAGRSLIDDLTSTARTDMYAALRVWEQYASSELKAQPGAMPTILHVAKLTERHFEGRSQQERNDVIVPNERDTVVCRPMDKESYQGPIVGTTPDYVVQRDERGDFILHRKDSLTGIPLSGTADVSIRYPFNALNGIGIASEPPQLAREALAQEASKTMERATHEREFG